jgi:O-antigen ligase
MFVLLVLAAIQAILTGVRLPRNAKTKWVLLFYVSLVLSSAYAIAKGSDVLFLTMRWTTYMAMLCLYFLMCFVMRTRKELDLFLVALLVSGLIATVSAYFSEGAGGYWAPIRKSGVGSGQNHAAGNLLMVLPFTFALASTSRSWLAKKLMLGCAMVLVFGFALALSRSGFIAAVAMGGLFFWRIRRAPDPRLIAAAVILSAVAIVAAPEGYSERLRTLLLLTKSSGQQARPGYTHQTFSGRLAIYEASVVGFATHPVLGIGADRYLEWVPDYNPRLADGFIIHNAVLSVACHQGLLGLIPYLAILILTYRDFSRAQYLVRSRREFDDPELKALYVRAVMAQLGYVGIFVVAQFQPGAFWRGMWVMFALSTVILALTKERLSELERAPSAEVASGVGMDPSRPDSQHIGAFAPTRLSDR